MRIKTVHLENFGIYRGEQEVSLETDPKKPVIVIHGENGTGKTTFLNAVSWCLLGARHQQGFNGFDLLNWAARKTDATSVGVRIEFDHEGENYVMSRGYQTKAPQPKKASDFKQLGPSLLRDTRLVDDPEGEIKRILPPEVVDFFMFDGEQLLDFERLLVLEEADKATEGLKANLELILGVPSLRAVRDRLREFAGDLDQQLHAILSTAAEDYGKRYGELKQRIQELDQQIQNHDNELLKVQEESRQIGRELAGEEAVRGILEEKTGLAIKKSAYLEYRRNAEEQLLQIVPNLHIELLRPILDETVSDLRSKAEGAMRGVRRADLVHGQIQLVQDCISRRKCLCGRDLEPLSLAILEKLGKNLQDELAREPAQVREEMPWNFLANALEDLLKENQVAAIKGLEEEISRVERDIGSIDQRVQEIDIALKGYDQESIATRMRRLTDLANTAAGLESSKGRIMEELGSLKEELRDVEAGLRAHTAKADERKLVEAKLAVTREAETVFELAVDEFRQMKRKEVESEASSAFEQMKRKPDFKRLKILHSYGLRIVAADGTEIPARSAGEGQIVALSLLSGLNQAARVTAPVMMDTPFGRLDRTHRANVLKYLSKMGEQVVLLVTSAELSEDDVAPIRGLVSREYRIKEISYEESKIEEV